MNAIVAIGSPALFRVVDAYRKFAPSAIWVLGMAAARDPNDPLLRSLEALHEPFMNGYFSGEAQLVTAAAAAELAGQAPPGAAPEHQRFAAALARVLSAELTPALALVEMLDRAHAVETIELVLTDGSTALTRAAGAWAQARGITAVTVPHAAALHRPAPLGPGHTIVTGRRAGDAFRAAGATDAQLLAVLPSAPAGVAADRGERRANARAAIAASLGWPAEDPLVFFEPASRTRESALESAGAFGASLAAIFAAFATARASRPTLRLAVVAAPSADGLALAGQAAAAAGIAGGDFAYAHADRDVWLAAADIAVSVDSGVSIEAARLGIPAVNLWRPENWALGAAFAAEDGVIDAAPHLLGPTLAALAGDAPIRAQIAAIAAQRITSEMPADAAASALVAAEIAALVAARRPPAVIVRKAKPDIVIWAPDYTHASGGIRALFRLCHLINMAGGDASMHGPAKLHPTWNAPRRDKPITDRTIVIVPEIVFGHPSIKRTVRWVLNKPGLLGGPKAYGPDEMVFYYAQAFREAAQAATPEILTDERELDVFTVEPELFYNDRSRPRLYDVVYIGKGEDVYRRVQPRQIRDALVIRRAQTVWPESREQTAALLRGCRHLYSFDANTAIMPEAVICGARAFIVRDSGAVEEDPDGPRILSDYVERFYTLEHVQRFLRLVAERWD